MYLKSFIAIALLSTVFGNSSCIKTRPTAPEALPPITQTGANTFGCLINGNLWLPKGYDGRFLNSRITIDPSFDDGSFLVRVYRIEGEIKWNITLTSDSIKAIGIYPIKSLSHATFIFGKLLRDASVYYCDVYANGYNTINPFNINGFIKVTRYDLVNKIFSGEFEVSFNNTACGLGDPVRITEGRFDYKL